MSVLRIIEPGLVSQLQGAPYRGRRASGMPLAGPADPLSRALANRIAGNGAESPAIETGFAAFEIEALTPVTLGVAGAAEARVHVNGVATEPYRSIDLRPGDRLRLGAPPTGCRTYIALAGGGFACPELMGAQSTYLPAGFGGVGLLKAGDTLSPAGEPLLGESRTLPPELRLPHTGAYWLRIVAAPESDEGVLASLTRAEGWRVGRRANRIGIELDGEPLETGGPATMLSSAVFPGTVQAPPSGQPFILGPDGATTGGYPRVGQVARADRHLIGQLRPGEHLRFIAINDAEARALCANKIGQLTIWLPDLILD